MIDQGNLPARQKPILHNLPFLGMNLDISAEVPPRATSVRFDGSESSVIMYAKSWELNWTPRFGTCSRDVVVECSSLCSQDCSIVLLAVHCSRFVTSNVPEVVTSCIDFTQTSKSRQDLMEMHAMTESLDVACVDLRKETANSNGGFDLRVSL